MSSSIFSFLSGNPMFVHGALSQNGRMAWNSEVDTKHCMQCDPPTQLFHRCWVVAKTHGVKTRTEYLYSAKKKGDNLQTKEGKWETNRWLGKSWWNRSVYWGKRKGDKGTQRERKKGEKGRERERKEHKDETRMTSWWSKIRVFARDNPIQLVAAWAWGTNILVSVAHSMFLRFW